MPTTGGGGGAYFVTALFFGTRGVRQSTLVFFILFDQDRNENPPRDGCYLTPLLPSLILHPCATSKALPETDRFVGTVDAG